MYRHKITAHKEKRVSRIRRYRDTLYRIIFGVDTRAGKIFDVILLCLIIFSVVTVVLESVASIRLHHASFFRGLEWIFTLVFTLEYLLRIISVRNPWKYVLSFYGIIDLIAIVPTYLAFFFLNIHSLLILRALRLLRIFRVFKLTRFIKESDHIMMALSKSRPKITVFVGAVLTIVLIMGTFMYLIEGEASGFTSIPQSMYWAIVTLTTVGYGDLTPHTIAGQILSSLIMIMGYAMIAVPTGIVSVEYANALERKVHHVICAVCGKTELHPDSRYCRSCGSRVLPGTPHKQNAV